MLRRDESGRERGDGKRDAPAFRAVVGRNLRPAVVCVSTENA
jgi:hypothetical protein